MALALALGLAGPAAAGSTGPRLAAFYDRFLALCGGALYEWQGDAAPRPVRLGARPAAAGVGDARRYALTGDGRLLTWSEHPPRVRKVMDGVASFAAGESGLLVIRRDRRLWGLPTRRFLGLFGESLAGTPVRLAEDACGAAVGDGADYYLGCDGGLWVRGAAHRGQYGDGRLEPADGFARTADGVVQVDAHTGHALILRRDGSVWGTGGNLFGPLGRHGYRDMAVRWGRLFEGARALATGASHSLALGRDGTLWAWGLNWGVEPRAVLRGVSAAAAGTDASLAIARGVLWQWGTGREPRRIMACGP